MKTHPLSEKLRSLSQLLDDHFGLTGDPPVLSQLNALSKTVDKIADAIRTLAAQSKPETAEVSRLLEQVYGDDLKSLKAFSKAVLGKAPTHKKGASLSDYRNDVALRLADPKHYDQVLSRLRRTLDAPRIDWNKDHADDLLAEIRKLGGCSEEQLGEEIKRLSENRILVERLANAAGIPVASAKSKKPVGTRALIKKLVALGRVYHENRA